MGNSGLKLGQNGPFFRVPKMDCGVLLTIKTVLPKEMCACGVKVPKTYSFVG